MRMGWMRSRKQFKHVVERQPLALSWASNTRCRWARLAAIRKEILAAPAVRCTRPGYRLEPGGKRTHQVAAMYGGLPATLGQVLVTAFAAPVDRGEPVALTP
jgi:hypothetical protein